MEAADSSETPACIYQTTRCHIPEDSNLQGSAVKTSTLTHHIHVSLVLRLFNAHCQYTPLLNLRPLICDLTLFGGLLSITLDPTCSFISYGSIVFYLRPLPTEHNYGVTQGHAVLSVT
jgi:hypothetical protein